MTLPFDEAELDELEWSAEPGPVEEADPGQLFRFAGEYEVIQPDERARVTAVRQVPYRWVCSLDIMRDGELYRGSGVLIGPRQVLTAAHNIYNRKGERPDSVHVVPARNGSDRPFGRFRAEGFQTSSEFLTHPVPGSRRDITLITLDTDAAAANSLGHWGSPTTGQGTGLAVLDAGFLAGRDVVVCGYPGDKCGGAACDPARGWTAESQADTMWSHFGPARFLKQMPGFLLHTADTHKGQSGSPVWIRFTSGRRTLVGIHVSSTAVPNATGTGVVTVNRAVHLDTDTVALIRSWM